MGEGRYQLAMWRGGVGGEEEVGGGVGGVAATCRVFQTFDTLPEQVDFIGLLRAQQEFLLPLVSDFKSNGVVQSAYFLETWSCQL